MINLAFGIVVGVAMYLIGLPQPYAWGLLAGVLNFAVFIGPIVMTFILLGVGIATFPGSLFAIAPPAIFVVLNLIEGQLVTPTVLGRRLTLNPLVVFATIAFWLWLWGPIGAFLAVPLLIIVTMILYHIMPGIAPKSDPVPRAIDWPGRQSGTNF